MTDLLYQKYLISCSSKAACDLRYYKIYGKRYLARVEEETQESAIKLSVFPAPYSFPFGPNFAKINLYRLQNKEITIKEVM